MMPSMAMVDRVQIMQLNLPTWLTLLRIALIPVFVGVFFMLLRCQSAVQRPAGLAALTDWLDGYLRGVLAMTSALAPFDPVADKLMKGGGAGAAGGAIHTPLMAVAATIIIGREIAISALRGWMAQVGSHSRVAVSKIGKLKTTVQMVVVLLLLYREPLFGFPTLEWVWP